MSLQEKTDRTIAVIVVLLFGLFIVYQTFYYDTAPSNDYTLQPLTQESKANFQTAAETDLMLVRETDQKVKKVPNKSARQPSNIDFFPNLDKQASVQVIEQPVSALPDSLEIIGTTPPDISMADSIQSAEVLSETEMKDSTMTTTEEETSMAESTALDNLDIKEQYHCGIIIGSYQYVANQEKIVRRLKAAGYKAFGYKEKGLNIAAIRLPCKTDILRSTLDEIHRDFTSSAFIITN